MRTRTEIEESLKTIIVPAGTEDFNKLLVELLLDVRDLLKGMREQDLFDLISEARVAEQNRRKELIKEKIKPVGR